MINQHTEFVKCQFQNQLISNLYGITPLHLLCKCIDLSQG
jgi:hypothetical protein